MRGSKRLEQFWRDRPLEELSHSQWESLCDGCARCCLCKLQDEDSARIFYTNVACKLLDIERCRCTDYAHRSERVSDCLALEQFSGADFTLLPPTCAYRLLAEGKDLPPWHPLVSGDAEAVHRAGISVRGKVVSEREVSAEEMVEHIITWW